jgi:Spy/CpxP family protein refolding chaperone
MSKSWFARIALFTAALLFMSSQIYAQGGGGGGQRGMGPRGFSPEERVKQLKDSLSLSDEQTAKVKTIFEHQQQEMMAAREKAGDDREAMRSAMTEIRTKSDKAILEILTEKQKAKYTKMLEEQQKRMQQRMGGGPPGGGPPGGGQQ